MAAYYNEFDPFAAAWLRELIKKNLIAPGDVDERSITDVKQDDLAGYTQCHFFAGIGVWSYALRRAGWPDDRPVWTGSPPCQPFSSAGKQLGTADERHLWQALFNLIKECGPKHVFGEQVAAAIGQGWFDALQSDLAEENYATGMVVLQACGVGAPHIRQRIFFVAERMADTESQRQRPNKPGCDSRDREQLEWAESRSDSGDYGSDGQGKPGPTNGFWRNADWLECRDGKWRPVEPGTFPMANGAPARVGRLRGYGNAINAEAAAAFIKAYMQIA